MKERVDEKGKVYTTRMSKEPLRVRIRVFDQVIEGTVHLHEDNRLKDELNQERGFIAVTGAKVFSVEDSRELYRSEFLVLNNDHILWAMPLKDRKPRKARR